jgi:hypothetical protein
MSPDLPAARTVVEKARQVAAKVRPGPMEGRRSLPIRATPEEITARWDDAAVREAALAGIPAAGASLDVGEEDRDWGRTVTLHLHLEEPVPGVAAQALTGKALRRLKALCETGEMPATDFNPSAREDAGEPAA